VPQNLNNSTPSFEKLVATIIKPRIAVAVGKIFYRQIELGIADA
jgi:hypothetical protein